MHDKVQLQRTLKSVFKLDYFHDNQWVVIEKLLKGEKVLLVEKTGYGKSLCYQFPAVLFPGITIVFSPLLALMRDQVNRLKGLGIAAACINSSQTPEENQAILDQATLGTIKILYIAPERMENEHWMLAVRQMNISMVVVDEAHCISVWGHDFRPSYRRIVDLIRLLPADLPILTVTATATKRVQRDIINQVGGAVNCVRGQLLRDNFELFVIKVKSEDEKMIWLGQYINNFKGSGLVYCGTQIATDIYSRWLAHLGINSVMYNAGLDSSSRKDIELGLLDNRYKCVVSTNALGMGLDKPDIRFIIHTQVPASPIHYYQEIGRAGRDGHKALIILLYNPDTDLKLPTAFIESSKPSPDKYNVVIELLKEEGLSELQLVKRTNFRQAHIRTIKEDLIAKGILHQVRDGSSKYLEYTYGAPEFDPEPLKYIRESKFNELRHMERYINTDDCRMKFLCEYLGDTNQPSCGHCDNDIKRKITVNLSPEWIKRLDNFKQHELAPKLIFHSALSAMTDGYAVSYYAFLGVGEAIQQAKQANTTLPEWMLNLTVELFKRRYHNTKYDMLLFVPTADNCIMVADFAQRLSEKLGIPFSDKLVKTRETKKQHQFSNGYLKHDNVVGAFEYTVPKEIKDKNILLLDDFCESGHTLKEVGRQLTKQGAATVSPIVLAQIVNSDNI